MTASYLTNSFIVLLPLFNLHSNSSSLSLSNEEYALSHLPFSHCLERLLLSAPDRERRRLHRRAIWEVARITVPITEADHDLLRKNGLIIKEDKSRVHYPVFASGVFKKVLDVVVGESDATLSEQNQCLLSVHGQGTFHRKNLHVESDYGAH